MTNVDADVLLALNAPAKSHFMYINTTTTSDMGKYNLKGIMVRIKEMAEQSDLLVTH